MISKQLCTFALNADIPQPVRRTMQLCLLDWATCALAGRDESAVQIVRAVVLDEAGGKQAALVGGPDRVPMRAAALVNGVMSHALDYDDTHFAHIGHPSTAVVPAALAVADYTRAGGAQFLDAALIGAEASIRIGVWLGRSHYQAGFHQTATAGAFGAALAAGRLLGLTPAAMAHALSIISTRASGLKSQFGSMGKPVNAGFAASNGVEAALLAQAGLIAGGAALDGKGGFGATHFGAHDMAGLAGLGETWMLPDISHKFHACCHGLHAMLEVLADIAVAVPPADVARVSIKAHPRWACVCNIAAPRTGLEVKFSFRHVAALALSGISTGALNSYTDEIAHDGDLMAVRDRVTVDFDDAIPETATQVTLTLADGSEICGHHDLSAPVPPHTRRARLLAKAAQLLGPAQAHALWAAIEHGPDMAKLAAVLRG